MQCDLAMHFDGPCEMSKNVYRGWGRVTHQVRIIYSIVLCEHCFVIGNGILIKNQRIVIVFVHITLVYS